MYFLHSKALCGYLPKGRQIRKTPKPRLFCSSFPLVTSGHHLSQRMHCCVQHLDGSASSWRSAHLAEMLYDRFLPPFSGRAASTGSPELAAFRVALALHLPSQRCRLRSFLPWLPPSPIRWLLSRHFSPPLASYPALLHLLPACSSALDTPMNTTSLLATSAGTQQTLCTERAGLP